MPDTITPDPLALAGMAPSLRATIAAAFREFADWYGQRGEYDRAHEFLTKASALGYGGEPPFDWEAS